ncbi:hypothetical protein NDN08_007092 [Rhodosorus marinus]|uniref:Cupin type-1 domain-containing protein n=1 Tax=Rhodosorus marinus TaxID=101924 RepID=A0AAV8UI86_9RHOD|nr:hypothetical protein NDN08_007092 [Rhodosorus marinus]
MKTGTFSFCLVLAVSALAVSAGFDPSKEVRDIRAELFPHAKDFKFNLADAPASNNGVGAKIQGGSQGRFPALNGLGVSYTLFTIDPCGMNLPHVHPRATELIYIIKGYGLTVGFSEENGGRVLVNRKLKKGWTTVFPEGLPHWQINTSCYPVQFISALSHASPGVVTVPDRFLGTSIPDYVLSVVFNVPKEDVQDIRDRLSSRDLEAECKRRCGIQ